MQADRYAVIGDPIDHSLSPVIQGAAFAAAGIPAQYDRLRVPAGQLGNAVRDGLSELRGFNVTIPHKQGMAELVDGLAPEARALGAVNTVHNVGGRLIGYNTDVAGFERALETVAPSGVSGPAVLFGAGGAARAVIAVLAERGMQVTVVNRTWTRAEALLQYALSHHGETVTLLDAADPQVVTAAERANVLVNATPLGMRHFSDASPLPNGAVLSPDTVVIDLVYGRETPFLRQAAAAGCRTQDGLEMLLQQAAESFHIWTGLSANVDIMRADALAALERDTPCSAS